MKDNILASVVLAGMIAFLFPLMDMLNHIDNWEVIEQPHGVAQLIWCLICALVAVGAALGLDIKKFVFQFIPTGNSVSKETLTRIQGDD